MHVRSLSRRRLLASVAASATLPLVPRPSRAQASPTLRVRSSSEIQDIDPVNPAASSDQDVMGAIFNKLVAYKANDPAWGWELEASTAIEQVDATHVRFSLMPGMAWTNGFGEVTAEDVKFSFERIADPAMGSWASVDWATLKEVDVIDPLTGVIVLNEPFAPLFNSTLPYGSGTIVCKKAVEALPEKKFSTEPPATCGPYKIESWLPKQKLTLTRHDGWPGARPDFDTIEIMPIEDGKAAELGFLSGDLDMTGISVSSIPDFRASQPAGTKLIERPSLFYEWLGLNVEYAPFDDARVRQAVSLAIDVDGILQAAYFGVAERATGIIAPGLVGHRPANLIDHPDLDKARALLAEAGLADGFATTLDVLGIKDHVSAAQVIQASLARIGIAVQINTHDSGTFWTLGIEAEGDAWKTIQMIYNRYNMAPDPYWATAWFVPDQIGEWNWERWNSPEYGDLHKQAVAETDPVKRAALYVRMQDLMEESSAYVFITHGVEAFLHRDTIVPAMRPDGGMMMYRHFKMA